MDATQFLTAVWPETGYYCVCIPAKGKGYTHHIFDNIPEAAAKAATLAAKHDVYFAVHALSETKVWDEKKSRSKETGDWVGGWRYRTKANMRAARAFYMDIDVGDTADKYPTQRDAIVALAKFCAATGLPKPFVVNSGRGVHVYWLLDQELPSNEWVGYGALLKNLTQHHGFRVDPSRTADVTSVLRVASTVNHKDEANPLPVETKSPATVYRTQDILDTITKACGGLPTFTSANTLSDDDLGSNVTTVYEGPPVTISQLGKACGQIRAIFGKGRLGNVHYTAWHKGLAVLAKIEDGREWAHKLSKGHPTYSREETDDKLDQQEGLSGPTTCAMMRSSCDPSICDRCFWWGKVSNPLTAARQPQPAKDQTKPPEAPAEAPEVTAPKTELLPPPKGFYRTDGGAIVFNKQTEDKTIPVVILQHDLYPLRRQIDPEAETDQHLWCAHLPKEEPKTFSLISGAIQEPVTLAKELSKQGVYILPENTKLVQRYMSMYIQDLQQSENAQEQYGYLGWAPDEKRFIFADKIFHPDGTCSPVLLRSRVEHEAKVECAVGKKGEMKRQIELMRFWNGEDHVAQQFYMLSSLATPIFFATGHHGAIVNASGLPGASKSTTLFAAMSMWGHPEKMAMNGNVTGSTANARDRRISMFAHLPVGLDEITAIKPDEAQNFALNVSQGAAGKRRADNTGELRATSGVLKSTLVLTTANTSLHALMADNNASGTAGSMRVFEIHFDQPPAEGKPAADNFLARLKENYGHIGEAFLSYVVQNRAAVIRRVETTMAALDIKAEIKPHERFWSAVAAVVIVTCQICNELGLLDWNHRDIIRWLVYVQFPAMRGVVVEEYPSPIRVLTDYMNAIVNDVVVATSSSSNLVSAPSRAVKARYEVDTHMYWLARDPFRAYCATRKMAYLTVVNQLKQLGAVVKRTDRKVLTAGTELVSGRSYCLLVTMKHPELKDHAPKLPAPPPRAKPDLRVVKNEEETA